MLNSGKYPPCHILLYSAIFELLSCHTVLTICDIITSCHRLFFAASRLQIVYNLSCKYDRTSSCRKLSNRSWSVNEWNLDKRALRSMPVAWRAKESMARLLRISESSALEKSSATVVALWLTHGWLIACSSASRLVNEFRSNPAKQADVSEGEGAGRRGAEGLQVALLSITACGQGLNLQARPFLCSAVRGA